MRLCTMCFRVLLSQRDRNMSPSTIRKSGRRGSTGIRAVFRKVQETTVTEVEEAVVGEAVVEEVMVKEAGEEVVSEEVVVEEVVVNEVGAEREEAEVLEGAEAGAEGVITKVEDTVGSMRVVVVAIVVTTNNDTVTVVNKALALIVMNQKLINQELTIMPPKLEGRKIMSLIRLIKLHYLISILT